MSGTEPRARKVVSRLPEHRQYQVHLHVGISNKWLKTSGTDAWTKRAKYGNTRVHLPVNTIFVLLTETRHQANNCWIRGRRGNTVHIPSASLSDSTATTCCGSLRRQSPRKRKSAWRRYTSTVLRKRRGNNKRGEQTGKVHKKRMETSIPRVRTEHLLFCVSTQTPLNVAIEVGWRSDAHSPLRARKQYVRNWRPGTS